MVTWAMLWLKAFHIVFVVTWFAGLFYLPRLFVYHAVAGDAIGRERFVVMERRLFVHDDDGRQRSPSHSASRWLRRRPAISISSGCG